MRYCVQFSYLGTDFHGSQSQPNGITVQETMEQSFSTILRAEISLTFAGRTDAGVHAEEMYAHFDYNNDLPETIIERLNSLLPPSIAIHNVLRVSDDWHARFSAIARSYEYRITWQKNPFLYGRYAVVAKGLDFERMNKAAQLLYGKQDFASFCRVHTDVKTTFCTISKAEWTFDEHSAIFHITADRFLRNMVRAIVGTLLDVGRNKITIEDFATIIQQQNRCAAGQSAPACGLYLTHIEY